MDGFKTGCAMAPIPIKRKQQNAGKNLNGNAPFIDNCQTQRESFHARFFVNEA